MESTYAVPDARLPLPQAEIAAVCRRLGVRRLWVFGSVLRDDFTPASDVDFLVEFHGNDAGPWLRKFALLEDELAALLGRSIDVIDRPGIEQSDNYIRRRDILGTARLIYAA